MSFTALRHRISCTFWLCLGVVLSLGAQDQGDAIELIESAIAQRAENLKRYYAYSTEIKERCIAHVDAVPFEFRPLSGIILPAARDTGLAYLSEALIDARYGDPFHYNQNIRLKREAGKLPIPNWQQLPAYDFNLLQERIYLNQASDRGFVSPLSRDGLRIYAFKIVTTSTVKGKEIARISFKPLKEKFPAMNGYIDLLVAEGIPLFAHFNFSSNNQLELMDSIAVEQAFTFVDDVYKAKYQKIELFLNLFGFQGFYQINLNYNNFNYLQSWEPTEFSAEVFNLEAQNFKPDTSYWHSWERSDRHERYFEEHLIQGNIERQFRSFEGSRLDPSSYVFYKNTYRGYTYRKGEFFWDLPPLYRGLGFNPVEGLYLRAQTRFGYARPNEEISLRLQARYGTAELKLKPLAEISWQGYGDYPLRLTLTMGRDYSQFNSEEPILPVLNTVYNLLLARNYINLYGKDFVKLEYQAESQNGLTMGMNVEYAERFPLFNRSNFNFLNQEASFDFNNQNFAPPINVSGFNPHNALNLNLSLSYQFKDRYEQRYRQRFQDVLQGRNSLKIRAPKIYYDLRLGIPALGGETEFAFQRLGIQHQFRWANIGVSKFDLSGGHFIHKVEVPFVDYQHFDGVQIFFLQPSTQRSALIKQFSTLPYYDYSTTDAFFELHYEHNFDGALLSNIGFMRRFKVHSLVGFNSLHLQNERPFVEIFMGFDNIFKVLRVEFAGGFDNFKQLRPAVRVALDFQYDYYHKNRR
jgi:hypothetical protein